MPKTKPGKHRHLDSRGKWTTDRDPDHVHDIDLDSFTAADVTKLLAIAGGSGGTTPIPNPPAEPPPAGPDTTAPVISNVAITNITTTGATVSWSLRRSWL